MQRKSYLLGSALVAALGGLLFGFDTAVISGTTDSLATVFHLDQPWLHVPWFSWSDAAWVWYELPGSFWLGFTVAIALIGTVVGSLVVGKPADRIGRRNVLLVIGVLYFVSALGSALVWDWCSFLFFRFLGGSAWAEHRWCRRCIFRRFHQPDCEGGWSLLLNSTSSLEFCWRSFPTT